MRPEAAATGRGGRAMTRRSWAAGLACGLLALVAAGPARANDRKLAGTWAWSY